MDIVIRLDLVGPVLNSELSILEGAEKERNVARSKVEEKIQEEFSKRQSGI
jgi:hypothetical protein